MSAESPLRIPAEPLFRGHELFEQALDNADFQAWLGTVGFLYKDSDEMIAQLRLLVQKGMLSENERKVFAAFEPYGSLTTYDRVLAALNGGKVTKKSCIKHISNGLKKIKAEGVEVTVGKPSNKIRGLGVRTVLSPLELVTAYLIPRDGEDFTTYDELTEHIYGTVTELPAVKLHMHRLMKRVPPGLELSTKRHNGYSRIKWVQEAQVFKPA